MNIKLENIKQHLTINNFLLSLCAVSTLTILTWLLSYTNYGIDFTDESFYLVWMKNPYLFDWSASQFGFIYHPLFLIFNGDIASLRQFNILITFGLAMWLAVVYLKELSPEATINNVETYIVAAGLAIASLIIFSYLILTPSYNGLAFKSLLIAAAGALLAKPKKVERNTLGPLLIALGGWLAFMAKPSTAALLAATIFVYLVLTRKLTLRLMFITLASTLVLLLISALLIDGSVLKFIDRMRTGVAMGGYMGAGHTLTNLFRLDEFTLNLVEKKYTYAFAVVSIFAVSLSSKKNKLLNLLPVVIALFFLLLIFYLIINKINIIDGLGRFKVLVVWGLVYGSVAVGFFYFRNLSIFKISINTLVVASVLFVMPYIFAFGTNNNYWGHSSYAAFFWIMAGFFLLGPIAKSKGSWTFIIPLALATHFFTATLLQLGIEKPYRQPQPLWNNASATSFGSTGSKLILTEAYSEYIKTAQAVAHAAGFTPKTPIIDLTGQTPGILYALDAENLGQAWTLGGYPGSLRFLTEGLNLTSCKKIAKAWLLVEPDGPLSISVDAVKSQGANFSDDYKQVGSWQTASGAGGFTNQRTQALFVPIAEDRVLETCESFRK